MGGKFKLTEIQELEVVARYRNGESIRRITIDYPVGRTAIGYVLKRHNVEMKSTGNSYGYANKKYTINHNYFSNIDNEEKAYWLGFISADGHVADDGVVIGLAKIDRCHLEKFLKAVGSDSPIKERQSTNSVVISIYSKQMVSDLRNLGLLKNKSKTMIYPILDAKLHKHFIRGVFDGDGCISKGLINFSGSIEMVISIKVILMNLLDIRDAKVQIKSENFAVVYWYKNRESIFDFMYKDANVYLERKYVKYTIEYKKEREDYGYSV